MLKSFNAWALFAIIAAAGCTSNVEDPTVNQQGRGGDTCVTTCDDAKVTCVGKCTDDTCKVSCQATRDKCAADCAP